MLRGGAEVGDVVIALEPQVRRQPVVGFGAALTDASIITIGRMPPKERDDLLREFFTPGTGLGISFVRVPIGATDFSVEHYTLNDAPPGIRDTTRAAFTLVSREWERLDVLRLARFLNPQLSIMATPWSAPAWMKQPATLYGGTLRDDAMGRYAEYLRRVVMAYDSLKVPVDFLSVQNEPQHAPRDYPGMVLSASQRAVLIGEHLGPLLQRSGSTTRLLEWDHNWDAPEEPLAVLGDARARPFVHGVAWHCYAGDVAAQGRVVERHPTIATFFTECSGGAWAPNFGDNLLWNVRTLIVGATQQWARGVLWWNLALRPDHGPHLGGCTNCRGVVSVDSVTHVVTRNEEYYALAHASRFVQPNAVRIASRVHGDSSPAIAQVAFRNPTESGNGAIVLIAANSGTAPVTLRIEGVPHRPRVLLPALSVLTLTVPPY